MVWEGSCRNSRGFDRRGECDRGGWSGRNNGAACRWSRLLFLSLQVLDRGIVEAAGETAAGRRERSRALGFEARFCFATDGSAFQSRVFWRWCGREAESAPCHRQYRPRCLNLKSSAQDCWETGIHEKRREERIGTLYSVNTFCFSGDSWPPVIWFLKRLQETGQIRQVSGK